MTITTSGEKWTFYFFSMARGRKMYQEHLEWPSALNCWHSFPFSFFLSFTFLCFFVFCFFVCLEDATWWFVIAKFNDAPGECIQEGGGLLLQLFFFFCLFYINRINFQDIEKGGGGERRWRGQGVKIGVNDVDGPPHPWIHQISKRGSSSTG